MLKRKQVLQYLDGGVEPDGDEDEILQGDDGVVKQRIPENHRRIVEGGLSFICLHLRGKRRRRRR